ncbi:MAG: thermonuclease family protein [Deltaproteobacteria bacterium]|nr:MAG: thermonuclease family protein [Deltaproteobacteria bacterium]
MFPSVSKKTWHIRIPIIVCLAAVSVIGLFIFQSRPPLLKASAKRARVRWVSDGDTIVLADGERVRYVGINAPEIGHDGLPSEPYGDEAKVFNRNLVLGRWVNIESADNQRDQYGRVLAYVFLEDGTFVNGELVRSGYAHLLRRQSKLRYWKRLLELQRQALCEKRGIWSLAAVDPENNYLGNQNSWVFHRPDCPFGLKTAPRNRVRFGDRHQPLYLGYSPCRGCRP